MLPDLLLRTGDCLEVMSEFDADSIDAIVTDPPYGLGFMGKAWDHGVPGVPFWTEALRVAKPGAHLVAFGGSRTYHRLTCAIEDAGWEIRDCLMWLYGSGFPKSLDVSKSIDKAAGAEREVVGVNARAQQQTPKRATATFSDYAGTAPFVTAPVTDAARQWAGWGTALKPAYEPIILARKPLAGTVAGNVQTYGTGAINVDGCRIQTSDRLSFGSREIGNGITYSPMPSDRMTPGVQHTAGRWPANVLLDDVSAELLDAQTGDRPVSGTARKGTPHRVRAHEGYGGGWGDTTVHLPCDRGGASRFFYCAKASAADRNAGCDDLPAHSAGAVTDRQDGSAGLQSPRAGAGRTSGNRNSHPTVKPTDVMRWLVRLVTPTGGVVLDPFMGSGSTGRAAVLERCRFVGIDLSPQYVDIARARIAAAATERAVDDRRQVPVLPFDQVDADQEGVA